MGIAITFITLVFVAAAALTGHLSEPQRADTHKFIQPKPDAHVTCVVTENCTLPCPFNGTFQKVLWKRAEINGPSSTPPIILKPPQQMHLHKDYKGISELVMQPEGGAMLRITGVQVKHQGLHTCSVTSSAGTIQKHIALTVHVPVEAPTLEWRGSELVCAVPGLVFPRPNVNWTGLGPTALPHPYIVQSETGLFSVNSSVTLTVRPLEEITCNISTGHSWGSATYRTNPPLSTSACEVTVPCTEHTAPVKSVVWSFNHSQTVLTQTGSEVVFSESWAQFVVNLTESKALVLRNLSQNQLGLFSCKLSTDSQTFVTDTEVTSGKGSESHSVWIIVGSVLGVTLFLSVFGVLLHRCLKKNKSKKHTDKEGGGVGEANGVPPSEPDVKMSLLSNGNGVGHERENGTTEPINENLKKAEGKL